jgi:hypothetical protein
MSSTCPGRASQVVGPTGQPLSLKDLPPRNTKRWVIRRKAELVAAVRGGLISLEEVCERYELSEEEFRSWERFLARNGVRGLRTTRLQQYRKTSFVTTTQSDRSILEFTSPVVRILKARD